MVKFNRVSGEGTSAVLTLAQAKTAHVKAQSVFDTLIDERRKNRDEMNRKDWREYNDNTADYQIECQDNLETTRKAVSRLLGSDVRGQTALVGTATEDSNAGGN